MNEPCWARPRRAPHQRGATRRGYILRNVDPRPYRKGIRSSRLLHPESEPIHDRPVEAYLNALTGQSAARTFSDKASNITCARWWARSDRDNRPQAADQGTVGQAYTVGGGMLPEPAIPPVARKPRPLTTLLQRAFGFLFFRRIRSGLPGQRVDGKDCCWSCLPIGQVAVLQLTERAGVVTNR